jgi:GT2 family glycosyltransferase
VIVVDDESGPETQAFLRAFAASSDRIELLRHETRQHYCRAANSGLRCTTAAFVVLLNSDTIVSSQWVEKLLHCAQTTPRAGMVGPLSNAASWQSIPSIEGDNAQTAVNALPDGMAPGDLDRFCEETSYADLFPTVSLLNGFCLGLRREVIETVGEFDEASFPLGFGEEDDYCLRAGRAGFQLAVATHTYVHHAKSKSYTRDGRAEIVRVSSTRLREKHGSALLERAVAQSQLHPLLRRMREAAATLYESRAPERVLG